MRRALPLGILLFGLATLVASAPAAGRRQAQAGLGLPRRPLGPLPARRHLAHSARSAGPGARPALPAPGVPDRLVADHRPVARRTPAYFTPESYLGTVHWYRKDFRLPAGVAVLEVGAALRVGQLPRQGVAERQAARHPRRVVPALRAARQERPPARREPPRGAGRQPPPEVRHPAALAAQRRARSRAAGGTTTGSCARSTCGAWTSSTSQSVFFEPSLRCRTCAATVDRARHGGEREHPRRDGAPITGTLRRPRAALPPPPGRRAAARRGSGPAADPQSAPVEPRATHPLHGQAAGCDRERPEVQRYRVHTGIRIAARQPPRAGSS